MKCLILLFLFDIVFGLFPDLPSDCNKFIVGNCEPNNEEIISVIEIGNLDISLTICQGLCNAQENCNTFRFDSETGECTLLHYRYTSSCDQVGGLESPELDTCLHFFDQDPPGCDGFIQEDCIIRCNLYDGLEKSCTKFLGPKTPTLQSCMSVGSTTTISTSIATSTIITSTSAATTTTAVGSTDGSSTQSPSCSVPEDITNGHWDCSVQENGEVETNGECQLICDPGFIAPHGSQIICTADQTWDTDPGTLTCVETVLAVIGGDVSAIKTMEILDLDASCGDSLLNLDYPAATSVAQLFGTDIIMCGGSVDYMKNHCLLFDTQTLTWSPHSTLVKDRTSSAGIRVGNKFFIIGGLLQRSSEVLDLDMDKTWRLMGTPLPGNAQSIISHCVVPYGTDAFLLIGGLYDLTESRADVYMFNVTENAWSYYANLNNARSNHACINVDGMVLVAGGQNGNEPTEILDADSDTFRVISPLNVGRQSGQMGVLPGNRIIINGGIAPGGGLTYDTIEEFDIETEKWNIVEEKLVVPRAAHAVVPVPRSVCH